LLTGAKVQRRFESTKFRTILVNFCDFGVVRGAGNGMEKVVKMREMRGLGEK